MLRTRLLPLALIPLLAACGSVITDPGERAAGAASACPSPVDDPAGASAPPPAGCAAEGEPAPGDLGEEWNRRLAENHRYREEREITAGQRAAAEPGARALARLLARIADDGAATDEAALREAVAGELGVEAGAVDMRVESFHPLRNARVSVARGPVCTKATVEPTGEVTSEVTGMILDGGCLPAPGH
ncbi:precorrin-3B C(17)-methyltransferase [Streptomyces fragilis]|uniref:Precorrin-3B C(17)-methyltransferase n=1 Tax=Streptomyces fragilis TaxID=67301 RepID=A0ABV2YR43_9ACTN|nr:precorrin-3B C(17)-methyltransferase [Streptomyces fragilis]